jgi:hypothetical protein
MNSLLKINSILLIIILGSIFSLSSQFSGEYGLLFGFIATTFCGLSLFSRCVLIKLNICELMTASILTGYSLGALVTYFAAYEYWQKELAPYTHFNIALCYVTICIFCTLLIILSRFSKYENITLTNFINSFNKDFTKNKKNLFWLIITISITELILILTGSANMTTHFNAIAGNENSGNLIRVLIFPLCAACPLSLGIFFGIQKIKKSALIPILPLLAINLVWVSLSGRRSIIFGMLVYIIGFKLGNKIVGRKDDKIIKLSAVPTYLVLLMILYFSWDLFSFSRFYYNYNPFNGDLISYLQNIFFEYYSSVTSNQPSELYLEFKNFNADNVSTRPFIFSFLLFMFTVVSTKSPLFGEDIWTSFLMSLPSSYIVDKSKIIAFEELYNKNYGLNLPDSANSYLLSSFVDFGWIGLFIYPLILVLTFNLIFFIITKINLKLIYIICISNLIQLALSGVEATFGFFFSNIRDLIFLVLILNLSNMVFKKARVNQYSPVSNYK